MQYQIVLIPLASGTFDLASQRVLENEDDRQSTLYSLKCLASRRRDRARAMVSLRDSVVAGFSNADCMSKDPDLEFLHGAEFDVLVERVRRNESLRRRVR